MRPIKFGDWIEKGLKAIGVTQDRMKWLLGVENCGCESRKKWINDWGVSWQFPIIMLLGGPGKATWR